jgi:Fe-S cluster assembly protein SufD
VAVDMFTPQTVERLDGPDWLTERRLAALRTAGDLPEPSADLEEWRYGRIDELDLTRFTAPSPGAIPGEPELGRTLLAEIGATAGGIILCNGRVVRSWLDDDVAASGVVFGPAALVDQPVEGAAESNCDRFAAWNDAMSVDPVVLSVPRGVTVPRPLVVVSVLDGDAEGTLVLPRLTIAAADDSEVSVVELSASADIEAIVVPVTSISVGRAARVRHSAMQDLGRRVWQLGSFVADVGQEAELNAAVAALGGDYARLRLDCRLNGRGASGNLASVYFGDASQMLDLRTFQEHRAPDTTSNLLFKGAVADESHSVYTGLIRIHPDARGSNAFQTNRNLKLSERAWAESVPNLEIENNEVRCSHASTVGPVDPDQRFYLESRGVPSEVADRLVVAGFFDEVLDDLPVGAVAEPVRRRINALLDRLVGVPSGADR